MNLTDKFIKYEYDKKLFDDKINNINYWYYIRENIYEKLNNQINKNCTISNNSPKHSFIHYLKLLYNLIINYFFYNPLLFLKKKDVLILSCSRRIKDDKSYECIYTDIISKNLKPSYYVFEEAFEYIHLKPVATKNLRYLDYIKVNSAIKKRLFKLFKINKLVQVDRIKIKELVEDINLKFSVSISKHEIIAFVEDTLQSYNCTYSYYEKILKKVKPKAIIEICHYEFTKLLINEVAKNNGVKIIELQHGVIGTNHEAYNFYEKINIKSYPDYIFLFGEYWKKNARFPIENSNLMVTGFPYFENKIKSIKKRVVQKKIILFISQPGIGEELSNLAVQLKTSLQQDKYEIVYKLHPLEYYDWENKYSNLTNNAISVIAKSNESVYDYFNISYCQVGVYSTAIFEGLAFNLKTIILKTYGHEFMRDLYQNGIATLVTNANEVLEVLENSEIATSYIQTELWQNDSISNILKNINSILQLEQN